MMERAFGTTLSELTRIREAVQVGKIAGSGFLSCGRLFVIKSAADPDWSDYLRWVPRENLFHSANVLTDGHADRPSGFNVRAHDVFILIPKYDATYWISIPNMAQDLVRVVGAGRHGAAPIIRQLSVGGDFQEFTNLQINNDALDTVCISNAGNGSLFSSISCFLQTGGTGVAEITDTGDDALYLDCRIGTTAAAREGDQNYLQNAGALRPHFKNCLFLMRAASAGDSFVELVASSQYAFFDRCNFYNDTTTATMLVGVTCGAGFRAILKDPAMVGAAAMGTTGHCFVTPGGMGLTVTAADVFNPYLSIDGAEPVAADT